MSSLQVADWIRLVQAEYHESPGLNLTRPQVKRLWGFDDETCTEVLTALESDHVLRRTARDMYVLTGQHR
jgi:hypothetical protein